MTPTGRQLQRIPWLPGPSPLRQLADCLRGKVGERTDWRTCLEAANRHYAAPALWQSLTSRGLAGKVDPEALQYLDDLRTLNGERNRRLAGQLADLACALNAVGITPVAMKGAAILASALRPELSTRMLVDLDILVAPEQSAAADAALRARGYRVFDDSADEHSAGSYFRPPDVGAVDLHVRLPDRMADVISEADIEARSGLVHLGHGRIRVPDTSLQFAMNIAHEMLHDQTLSKGRIDLRYLLDLVDLATAPGAALDRAWIGDKCRHWKFELALELQARMVSDLLGIVLEPETPRTALGAVLHRRRLLKAHNQTLDRLEWTLVWRLKNVLRAARADPTPLVARWREGRRKSADTPCHR